MKLKKGGSIREVQGRKGKCKEKWGGNREEGDGNWMQEGSGGRRGQN